MIEGHRMHGGWEGGGLAERRDLPLPCLFLYVHTRLTWATSAVGARRKQSSGLESLETRKKVMSLVLYLTAVTCKRVVCVNVEHKKF